MIIEVTVNGEPKRLQARSGDRLLDLLNRELSLFSVFSDCLCGRCGRCLIFFDGRLAYSCLIPAIKAKGSAIVTYEALEETPEIREIVDALEKARALPCAFCRTGKIMAIADLLARIPLPEEWQILEQLEIVPCPCTDPVSLVAAVGFASEARNKRKFNRADK